MEGPSVAAIVCHTLAGDYLWQLHSNNSQEII